MSGLMINIEQEQAVMLLAQAQANLTVAVQALQQSIAAAQAAGAANVVLTADQLQAITAQVQLAVEAVIQARVRQMQMILVRIRGETNIFVRARQMQIANILARARADLNATVRALQRLQSQAQAMGGMVAVALADAQQLVATIQATLSAVVQALILQRQVVNIVLPQAQM